MKLREHSRLLTEVLSDAYVRPLPRAEDGPLVTVVIATYNRSEVLRYALASALRQSYRNLEVLVIGDACTDDSAEVVAGFGDPRVRWHNLEANSGSQAAPNQAGLEAARGELVAYLGHDDVWRLDHIAVLVANLQRTGADASSTVTSQIWPRPVPFRRFISPPPGEFVPPSSLMHTRAAGLAAGGWRDWRTTVAPPDVDFIKRLGAAGKRFSRVRALTVLKFPSALRPNSYRARAFREQERASRRVDRRFFVAQEVAIGLAMFPLRSRAAPPQTDPGAQARPGGVVHEFRRIRGLAEDSALDNAGYGN